jgi:hypothetical protein
MNNDELMYKQKYLKYKQKYFELKQDGGLFGNLGEKATLFKLGTFYNNNSKRCIQQETSKKEDYEKKNTKEIDDHKNKLNELPNKLEKELKMEKIKYDEATQKITSANEKEIKELQAKIAKLEVAKPRDLELQKIKFEESQGKVNKNSDKEKKGIESKIAKLEKERPDEVASYDKNIALCEKLEKPK